MARNSSKRWLIMSKTSLEDSVEPLNAGGLGEENGILCGPAVSPESLWGGDPVDLGGDAAAKEFVIPFRGCASMRSISSSKVARSSLSLIV